MFFVAGFKIHYMGQQIEIFFGFPKVFELILKVGPFLTFRSAKTFIKYMVESLDSFFQD